MRKKSDPFGSISESIFFASIVVIAMWLVFWAEQLYRFPFHEYGVLPRSVEGLKGILFMPLLHAEDDINHIINNSFPTFVLLAAIVYFYRDVALKVFVFLWFGTGLLLWAFAENVGSYHIGMSGVVYAMLGFVFTSGVLRKYLPLQAISLFVVFVYGNLVWGIFPLKDGVSWEGHFMGLIIGVIVAFGYRRESVQRPKFQYEIEKELGIEPPDLEGIYNERMRQIQLQEEERQRQQNGQIIVYHYVPEQKTMLPDEKNEISPQ